MKKDKVFLAVDMGASSGRVLAGLFNGKRLRIEEVHRFRNSGCRLPDGWHWEIVRLFADIKEGLRKAGQQYGDALISVGVDTWGVDYGLLDKQGRLLGLPYMYRDERTHAIMSKVQRCMSRSRLYRRTGIQSMYFNTLNQLFAEKRTQSAALESASRLLFIPDLMHYWLSGEMANEYTIASTSQLIDAARRSWATDVIKAMGLPGGLFGPVAMPGEKLGGLLPVLREELGIKRLEVVLPGSHDTASAVVAVPAVSEQPAYLSSGTWSLLGAERASPLLTPQAERLQFTNEGGVNGTIRLLKNITGLWLIQEARRVWAERGNAMSFAELAAKAEKAGPAVALIDPDDSRFATPGDMPARIQQACRDTGQRVPRTVAQVTRVIYDSLAARYREVFGTLAKLTEHEFECLHVVGGGSQDEFLNQLTANALDKPVVAGPVEATAIGNMLVQMMTAGDVASLNEARLLVKESFPVRVFAPR